MRQSNKTSRWMIWAFWFAATICPLSLASSELPADDEIHRILVQRVDEYRQSVGIVVGLIDASGPRIVSHGTLAKDNARVVDGDTVFEIGSITKVFTSLLLTDMVRQGEVALTDPVSKYLPEDVKMPQRGGREITLQDLATHTSGLPDLPTNHRPRDRNNPFSDYTVEQLYSFLTSYQLQRDIGTKYEYSNLGVGLLGHVLSLRAGVTYETLFRQRIARPLGLPDTRITPADSWKRRFARGHNARLEPVSNWDAPALAGAGALRSTAVDMVSALSGVLGYSSSTLAPAIASALAVRRPTGEANVEIALGWHVFKGMGKEFVFHEGETGGYQAFIGYDQEARKGVVVLSNSVSRMGISDIGMHLLDSGFPIATPRLER